ncbi:12486_t:CDS:2, partial [Cetraspora pellucida]
PPQSDEQTSSEEEEVRSTIRKGKRKATDIAERPIRQTRATSAGPSTIRPTTSTTRPPTICPPTTRPPTTCPPTTSTT